jgi:hypothetical protein
MGFLGLFRGKGKDIEIPPPPPPILPSEPIPAPLGVPPEPVVFEEPKKIEPVRKDAPPMNLDDFFPQGKPPVFGLSRPEIPDFSRPIAPKPELKSVAPEDFGSAIFEEDSTEMHIPEPVAPMTEEHFQGISPALRQIEEVELAREVRKPVITKPLFVKADDYKSILGAMSVIKVKIEDSEKILNDLNELKNLKDKSFEKWRTELEDIQRKLLYVDKTLYEKR